MFDYKGVTTDVNEVLVMCWNWQTNNE